MQFRRCTVWLRTRQRVYLLIFQSHQCDVVEMVAEVRVQRKLDHLTCSQLKLSDLFMAFWLQVAHSRFTLTISSTRDSLPTPLTHWICLPARNLIGRRLLSKRSKTRI